MVYDFSLLRPEPTYPTYPKYHIGKYLEDYFFEFFLRNKEQFDKKNRILLPISWTTLYVQNQNLDIQKYLNVLDPKDSYIVISQHDEGIKQKLPPNTIHFGAGGLGGGIPIPLICSPIPYEYKIEKEKDVFCSFVGSMTHSIRMKLYDTFAENSNFYFTRPKEWKQSVSDDELRAFCEITIRSKFALAPRGYGLSSFRLYEILQLGAIPVYVSDHHWLPFQHVIPWNEFCVIIYPHQIYDLENILKSISEERQLQMLEKGKEIWNDYFTLENCCKQILDML